MSLLNEQKLGLCGFGNIGNTCYMNSILQLLIHSKLIVNFMLSKTNPFIESINNNKADFENYLKQNIVERFAEQERKRLCLNDTDIININSELLNKFINNTLTIKLAEIINTIIYKGNSCIIPSSFKQMIDVKIPAMRGMTQQDSHELLNALLDNLIEETGNDCEPTINNVPEVIKDYFDTLEEVKKKINATELKEEKKLIINKFNEYKQKNKKYLNTFVGLKFMTDVFKKKRNNLLDTTTTGYNPMIFNLLTFNIDIFTCLECSNESCRYEYCTILSLPVKPTLKECFEEFIKQDIIDRRCDICKHEKSMRKTQIWRPGTTLFIHLKRFNSLPNGRTSKNNSLIDIPHQLDMSEFCDNSLLTETSINYKYKLKGISNHMGNLYGGHYTSDCVSIIDNTSWYHFDDSSVSKYQNNNIDTSNAYILMYEIEY